MTFPQSKDHRLSHEIFYLQNNHILAQIQKLILISGILYIGLYLYHGAYFAAASVFAGLLLQESGIRLLQFHRQYFLSRVLLISICNLFYILGPSMGFNHDIAAEFYGVPATILGLMLFNFQKVRYFVMTTVSFFLTFNFIHLLKYWSIEINFLPGILQSSPTVWIENANYFGSFLLMTVALTIFVRSLSLQKSSDFKSLQDTKKLLEEVLDLKVKSEKRLNLILNTMSEGVLILDSNGKFVQHNESALQILDFTSEDLLGQRQGQNQWETIRADGSPYPENEYPVLLALQKKMNISGSVMGLKKTNGQIKWLRINAKPFVDHAIHDTNYALCTMTDISDMIEAKTHLEEFFEASTDLMCITGMDGSFKRINPSFIRILGFSENELLERSFLNFIHADDLEKTKAELKKLSHGTINLQFENRYRTKDEDYIYLSWSIQSDPQFNRLFAIARDVTSEKKKNLEMQNLSLRLEEAQEVAKIGSWSLDIRTKKIEWSKQMYVLFNWPEEKNPPAYEEHKASIHEDDRQNWEQTLLNSFETETPFRLRFRCNHGNQIVWIEALGKIVRDTDHVKVGISGTCQDITERVQTDEENNFILDALKIGVWKYNVTTQKLDWDKSMYALYGLNPKDFSGHYEAWVRSLSNESREKATFEIEQAVDGKREFNTEFEILTPNGLEKKMIRARGKVIKNNQGQGTVMYGINFDITKEVQLESLVAQERAKAQHASKLAALGEMSAGIAHEINNPLAIIKGNMSLLERYREIPEKFELKVAAIIKAIDRITKIVAGLRKLSRADDDSVRKVEFLSSIIEESILLTEDKARRNHVQMLFEKTTDTQILCDDAEIEQVLVNLINNSIDAVKEAPRKWIKFSLFEEETHVILQVIDSGQHISTETEMKLFQPFFTTKGAGGGTGLGLSISKGIIEQHKGTISLNRSIENTCMEIRLPRIVKAKKAA